MTGSLFWQRQSEAEPYTFKSPRGYAGPARIQDRQPRVQPTDYKEAGRSVPCVCGWYFV